MEIKPFQFFFSVLLFCLFLFAPLPSLKTTTGIPLLSVQTPEYWELRIQIKSKGDYEIKEGEENFTGQYSYSAQWTGCLEEDDSDFLIYYENEKLLKWEAQEKSKGQDGSNSLATEDFTARPRFEFNYLIKKEDSVDFDFSVEGFEVPRSSSKIKHRLTLPASAEHTERTVDNYYNLHIAKGSNRIQMPTQNFSDERTNQSFSWNWEHQGWTKKEEKVVFFAQSHTVDVEVTIITHFK
jgi:hypothetical protein